jgi:hypothetical protein
MATSDVTAQTKVAMILFYSPIDRFIHKVIVVAHDAGLADALEIAPTYPLREGHDITALNPTEQGADARARRRAYALRQSGHL